MRIGLVLNILDEEYQISVYKGIKRRAAEKNVDIICFQQENTGFSENTFLAHFPKKDFFNLDGIILLTSVVADNNEINQQEDIERVWGKIPVISIGQKVSGVPSLLVQTDDSMRNLVRHLIQEHKYKKFIYISGSQNHHDAIIRENIFIETINEYKKEIPDLTYSIERAWFTEMGAIQVMKEYYEKGGENPDAIVCANDNMAIGVYKFFKINRHNPQIKECAVTGFDDIPQGRFEIPSLTTIRQPLERIGVNSVDSIVDLINQKKIDMEAYVESSVILRESCGCNFNTFNNKTNAFVEEMQSNYIQSEQLLRMVSHIGQDLNYVDTESGLKFVINVNMEQYDVQHFCVLSFTEKVSSFSDLHNQLIRPVYVRRNSNYFEEFCEDENMTLGEFYQKYLEYDENKPNSLVLKLLYSGKSIIGCVFYDSFGAVLPYLTSISINIAQTLNRIAVSEEAKKRSEYLEKEVEKRTKELIKANNRRMEVEAEVLRISEIERKRFSNDLHDDICQRLAGISMLCRSYSNQNQPIQKAEMTELAELISDTLQTTRQYAHNSYPVELESLGMNHSISNLCNSFEKQSGIQCDYEWQIPENIDLNRTERLNIFRIIQEALHNVMKHANAKSVKVSLMYKKNQISIKIIDDGTGLEKLKERNEKGLGLNSMEYRANQIGATFKIKNNKPSGTYVEVLLNK